MKLFYLITFSILTSLNLHAQVVEQPYLSLIIEKLNVKDQQKTVNFIFHGHSVPAGFYATPVVNSLQAYPNLTYQLIKKRYQFAVVNIITTAKGGEGIVQGAERFKDEVLTHKPDVVFIDYGLNDMGLAPNVFENSLIKMVELALAQGVKVVLLTPTPHQGYDLLSNQYPFLIYREIILKVAKQWKAGVVDSFNLFKQKAVANELANYMSHINHPNEKGHQLIADEIFKLFDISQ